MKTLVEEEHELDLLLRDRESIESQLALQRQRLESGVIEDKDAHFEWQKRARHARLDRMNSYRIQKKRVMELKGRLLESEFAIDSSDPINLLQHAHQKMITMLQELEIPGEDEKTLMAAIRKYLHEHAPSR